MPTTSGRHGGAMTQKALQVTGLRDWKHAAAGPLVERLKAGGDRSRGAGTAL